MNQTKISMLTCIFLVLSIPNVTSADIVYFTWEVSDGGNGHRYGLTEDADDWLTTSITAIVEGGTLATITSQAEQNFIETTFGLANTNEPFWLGATDNDVEGVWVWETGEPFVYENWKSGEPNNQGGNENYLTINWESVRGNPGTWNDVPINGTFGYDNGVNNGPYRGIVELNAVPEPNTAWSISILAILGLLRGRWRKSNNRDISNR